MEKMSGNTKNENSLKKKCKVCGKPYKNIPQIIPVLGKAYDRSYQVPDCNCEHIEAQRKEEKKQGQELAEKIKELKNCGISIRFLEKSFSNFEKDNDQKAYNLCRDYAKSFGKNKKEGLLLCGAAGTGKTHLAVAVIDYVARLKHKLLKKGIIFITVSDLVDEIRKKQFQEPKDYYNDTYRDSIMECDLLVLDDLGTESITSWTVDLIHQIIDYRYRERKQTMFTTNLSLDDIRKIYGERTFSRIYEMCQGVDFTGIDYRSKGSEYLVRKKNQTFKRANR